MDKKSLVKFKKLLLEEKQRIQNNSRNSLKNEINISQDDLPDESDLAATEINQSLVFKLRDRERMMMAKIDAALNRIDQGTFGSCESCEEDIEPRRLEARPFSTQCIACKEQDERRDKIYA